jgi:uncharacterized surface protein with fasciclin (FAS1) repeats
LCWYRSKLRDFHQTITNSNSANFFDISTDMKLTSLSQTARTFVLMTLLSATIGTSVQQSAQARNQVAAQPTVAPTNVASQPTRTGTVVDIAAGNANFSTLVTAVKAAGLAETLSGKGQFTVFAPTNRAFAALPKGTLAKLLKPENRDALRQVLTYHVVSGELMAKNLRSGRVATVEGSRVTVRVQHGRVRVNNARVVTADVDASNGVVHAIDRVLLPPDLKL